MIASGIEFLSDILLGAGALAAAFYCVVLSRKLNSLTGLDQELGTAIAVLSKQVDEMTTALETAQVSAAQSRDELGSLTERAETVALTLTSRLEQTASDRDSASLPEPKIDVMAAANVDSGGLAEGAPSLFVRHSERVAS